MSLIMGSELNALIAANAAALAPNFVNIQGGTFMMGADDLGADEKPVHEVTVSDFRMGKFPVTIGGHRALVDRLSPNPFVLLAGSGSSKPKVVAVGKNADALGKVRAQDILGELTVNDLLVQGGSNLFSGLKVVEMRMPELDSKFDHPRKPIVVVNWYESVAHALLRGAILATEAQWEYAATCGGRFKYGTSSGELRREEAHYYPHSEGSTAEVGSYPANVFGLSDMTGNVWEWCMDLCGKYFSDSQRDPTGSVSGRTRVLRGGSWDVDNADLLRAAYRFSCDPGYQYGVIGFRLVAPQDSSK